MSANTPAFAFDIDGVLLRGKKPIEHARETIQYLQQIDIPFILLTNGGGLDEKNHTARLASRLDLNLDHRQFVQSHSPYHKLVQRYGDEVILAIGGVGDQIQKVARSYGFEKVITPSDIFVEDPSLHPFPEMTQDSHREFGRHWHDIDNISKPLKQTRIAAILVWSSPRDWCFDVQLILDLLLSREGFLDTRSSKNGNPNLINNGYLQENQPDVYFCNPDLKWATSATHPRLAQGAFKAALTGLWQKETGGADISYKVCGKPTHPTYQYGEKALQEWNERQREAGNAPRTIQTVYMIGDNPASDIQGARNFMRMKKFPWKGVLVETGVYEAGTIPEHEPTHIAPNVNDAVRWALKDFLLGPGKQ